MPAALEQNIHSVFQDHKDVWEYVHQFYTKYSKLPSKAIVKENFKTFDFIDTSSAPLQYYIDEAKKQSLARNVREELHKTIALLKDAGPQAALNFITTQSLKMLKSSGALRDTNLAGDYQDRVNDFATRAASEKKIIGVPSGIKVIDAHFGGWQPGDFIVLLGWTASGKSWMASLFACNAWLEGYTPLIISLEMNKEQMGYRFDTILNQGETFRNSDLMFGRGVSKEEYQDWADKQFSGRKPIHLVTSDGIESATQNIVQAKIEQYQPDLVILDYHGLFDDAERGGTETDRARNLSKAFKKIAVKQSVPIIDIAAVTMSDGHGERAPDLNEVAWSKQLAFDADLVLAIHRDIDSNIFEVISRKVRRGQEFAFRLQWELDTGKREIKYDF